MPRKSQLPRNNPDGTKQDIQFRKQCSASTQGLRCQSGQPVEPNRVAVNQLLNLRGEIVRVIWMGPLETLEGGLLDRELEVEINRTVPTSTLATEPSELDGKGALSGGSGNHTPL